MFQRRRFLKASLAAFAATSFVGSASAFVVPSGRTNQPLPLSSSSLRVSSSASDTTLTTLGFTGKIVPDLPTVAYKPLQLTVPGFDVSVPIACWFPVKNEEISTSDLSTAVYEHNISVKRIGQLLAGWSWIPKFAERQYLLKPSVDPSSCNMISGKDLQIPTGRKVVILAHGYLGGRFDFSHIAEALAEQGFVCFAPEYPESLAASYERVEGLDRAAINKLLLKFIDDSINPKAYGIVGHSLGCGTALQTGDDDWARVLVAGRPPAIAASKAAASDFAPFTSRSAWNSYALSPDSPLLFISSVNDCTVKFGGGISIPSSYSVLKESDLSSLSSLDKHSALIFDRPDAPNHISYLAEDTNNAMINFLSPLLPVAQALNIPVLDFDKYKESQDSIATAKIMKPLVSQFLMEQMGK